MAKAPANRAARLGQAMAVLEEQLDALDQLNAHLAAAHLDAAICQLRFDSLLEAEMTSKL